MTCQMDLRMSFLTFPLQKIEPCRPIRGPHAEPVRLSGPKLSRLERSYEREPMRSPRALHTPSRTKSPIKAIP